MDKTPHLSARKESLVKAISSFEDDLSLGAEATVLHIGDHGPHMGTSPRLLPPPRVRQSTLYTSLQQKLSIPFVSLGHSMASSGLSSETSKTASSVSEVLQLCAEDAEEILFQLGFGCDQPHVPARIPARFFSFPSKLRGINFRLFLESQLRRLRDEDPGLSLASRFRQVEVLTAMANAFYSLYSHVSRTPLQKLAPPEPGSALSPAEMRVGPRFFSSVRSEPRSPVERFKDTVSKMCLYTGPSLSRSDRTSGPSPSISGPSLSRSDRTSGPSPSISGPSLSRPGPSLPRLDRTSGPSPSISGPSPSISGPSLSRPGPSSLLKRNSLPDVVGMVIRSSAVTEEQAQERAGDAMDGGQEGDGGVERAGDQEGDGGVERARDQQGDGGVERAGDQQGDGGVERAGDQQGDGGVERAGDQEGDGGVDRAGVRQMDSERAGVSELGRTRRDLVVRRCRPSSTPGPGSDPAEPLTSCLDPCASFAPVPKISQDTICPVIRESVSLAPYRGLPQARSPGGGPRQACRGGAGAGAEQVTPKTSVETSHEENKPAWDQADSTGMKPSAPPPVPPPHPAAEPPPCRITVTGWEGDVAHGYASTLPNRIAPAPDSGGSQNYLSPMRPPSLGQVHSPSDQQANSFELEEVHSAGEDDAGLTDGQTVMAPAPLSAVKRHRDVILREDSVQSDSSGYADEDYNPSSP
ncbi:uncharacterized protein tespa1 isoform X2 [Conger conger]|uniref:uncharacterized protein tespa1 isoform X2 n=1 Tax=Conger conger TaxID=82655 RepID=UPI002A59FE24|nr:uncharacterized protein tespa1 isoform X2 [Conger conger]